MNSKNNSVRYFTITALFIAITLFQNFVFLGYIPSAATPLGVNITIIQITVALAAILLGPRSGLLVGITWGVSSLILAWTAASGLLGSIMFRNPITAIVPRAAIGLIIGILFNVWLRNKSTANRSFGLIVLGGLSAFINTALVVISVWLQFTFANPDITGVPKSGILTWLITAVVGSNGIIEIIASAILLPIIATVLLPIVEKRGIIGRI